MKLTQFLKYSWSKYQCLLNKFTLKREREREREKYKEREREMS
jgi:hypothetical protein